MRQAKTQEYVGNWKAILKKIIYQIEGNDSPLLKTTYELTRMIINGILRWKQREVLRMHMRKRFVYFLKSFKANYGIKEFQDQNNTNAYY